MSTESIGWILREIRRERGRMAEPLADMAAKLLLNNNNVISDWWPATNSQDRILGIDRFALRIVDGKPIPIQIKTSEVGQALAEAHYPDIPVLLVVVGKPLEEIAAKIIQVVQNAV